MQGIAAGRDQISVKHIGGAPTTFSENGLITDLGRTCLDTLGNVLQTNYPVTDSDGQTTLLQPVVFHRTLPASSPTIVRHVIEPTTRILRRRTVGYGT